MTRPPKNPRFVAKRVVLVPGVPALLPSNASIEDPIAELRAACLRAVGWLVEPGVLIVVHCSGANLRLADYLIGAVGGVPEHRGQPPVAGNLDAVLVIGNGSARRSEKAPGYLDDRSHAFDADIGSALRLPDPGALAAVDRALADELLADVDSMGWLGAEVLTPRHRSVMLYDDDPYGVQYWVARWESADE